MIRFAGLILVAFVLALPARAHEPEHDHDHGEKLGTVHFSISCKPEAQASFDRGVALLHSFGYFPAADAFAGVLAADPACAMGEWGIAMSYFHEIWAAPTADELAKGSAAAARAVEMGGGSDRERAFIAAIAAFYRDAATLDHRTRVRAYEQAMTAAARAYPDDVEVAIFHALSLLAVAYNSPPDNTYALQKEAASILNGLLPKYPDHPGIAHYMIHSFDYPELASLALPAARAYAAIAPDATHALHMPAHIFIRLGFWQESIKANLASAEAGTREAEQRHPGAASFNALHAIDYLVYAYLQTAEDSKARELVERVNAVSSLDDPQAFAAGFALVAAPARYALERHQWREAADLPDPPRLFPWDKVPYARANTEFARAVGAARSGDVERARQALARLAGIQQVTRETQKGFDWTTQIEIQRLAASGWLAHAEGNKDEALRLLRAAADLEDSTSKHPVTPGALLPAREQLADLLMEAGDAAAALVEYDSALRAQPARYNSLRGAALAAERAGKHERAIELRNELVAQCRDGDGERAEWVRKALAVEATSFNPVQVTATRKPEPIADIPASMTIVTGAELRARGARDLRTALSLAAGVEGTPGGDGGPAGSVPSIWGLREADAYLLVVDGVPWGGAFNPATPSIALSGVDRIEILRGAAPVMYGATSFVGVIHVIHHAPGDTPSEFSVSGGSHGSYGLSGNADLPSLGEYQQALTVDLENRGFDEDRTSFDRYRALYRGAVPLGTARFHVDGDVSILSQDPAGNLLLRDGPVLHRELPVNANYNPAGAAIDQDRYHLALGLDGNSSLGDWSVSLAVTRTEDDLLRGFLRGNAFVDPPDAGVGDGLQADGYSQGRQITDLYFDVHVTTDLSADLNLTYGVDFLHGDGSEHAINFGYCIDAAGQEQDCAGAHHADELVRSSDRRNFAGLYAQTAWRLAETVDVLAGLRLNHTRETAFGRAIDNTGPLPVIAFEGGDERSNTRLSGVIGANWHAWSSGSEALTLYADYRNSYKPLAIDFGPEAETDVLEPETAESYEAGARMLLLDGRSTSTPACSGWISGTVSPLPMTAAAISCAPMAVRRDSRVMKSSPAINGSPQFQLAAHYAYHDAQFVRFTRDNGADAAGNRFEMSPRHLGGIGVIYTAATGFGGSVVADYIGSRKFNKSNTVEAGGYTTIDATLSYRFGKYRVQLGRLQPDGPPRPGRRERTQRGGHRHRHRRLLPAARPLPGNLGGLRALSAVDRG